ncbi:MAG: hypothetical protein WAP35_04760 [Solirubrobacterales bacterium]
MGKRSRRQLQDSAPARSGEAVNDRREKARAKRAELRDRAAKASEVAERSIKQRPPAPWDPFPLTELAVLVGIILIVSGVIVGESLGNGLLAAGLVLACLGGLDTALREHFNGYRPHAGLLAGILAFVVLFVSTAVFKAGIIGAALAIGVFALAFPALRRTFIQRSGGKGVL